MDLDGIVTFFSSYHALRAERAVKMVAIPVRLVPAPRDLSPTCATALRFPWEQAGQVASTLATARVEIDQTRHYPEAQNRPAGWKFLR